MSSAPITSPAIPLEHRELCIAAMLGRGGHGSREGPAIFAPGRAPLTYDRLRRLIHDTHGTLNAMGLGRNDRVAVVVSSGAEMAAAFVAVAASAACVPLNPAYRGREFEFYLSDAQAKALVVESGIDFPAAAVARRLGMMVIQLHPDLRAEAGIFTLAGPTHEEPARHGLARPEDTALVLYTSGTTARPKQVPLTHANICASASAIAASLGLHHGDRCLNVMPLYHIHGLVGATLATLSAGASIVCPAGFEESAFFDWMAEFCPSWYTAVPTIHHAILSRAAEFGEIIARHPLRFVRSCSAPLAPRLMAEMERVLNTPVIEAYGMTEASHQICSNPLPPRLRKPGSVGVATGCDVAVMDEAGALVSPGVSGEIVIRGPNVTRGYENNPDANMASFVHGWFRTGDLGLLDADGYLFINGRLKEVINRGGLKTSPREIEEVLLDCPGIEEAAVFGTPHSALGEDIVAAVVLGKPATATEEDIRQFAASRLADFRVPSRIFIVDALPKGGTGKLQRSQLAERFAPLLNARFVEPATPLEAELARTWARVLGVAQVGAEDNFFELGGTSLSAVRMITEVQKIAGRSIHVATLYRTPTVRRLAQALREETHDGCLPIVPLHPGGSRPPLFFLHGDYDGAGFYCLRLAQALGPEQPFYVLHPHGFDGHPVPVSIEAMAADYVARIRALRPRGPYVLGGYCNGGMVAFDIARRLHAEGERIDLLVLMDVMAPNIRLGARFLRGAINGLGVMMGLSPWERQRRFLALRRRYMRVAELARERKYGAALRALLTVRPPEWDTPARDPTSLSDAYRDAMDAYVLRRYDGRVLLILSDERWAIGTQRRWQAMAPHAEIRLISGDHFTFITEHLAELGEHVRASLEGLQGSSPHLPAAVEPARAVH